MRVSVNPRIECLRRPKCAKVLHMVETECQRDLGPEVDMGEDRARLYLIATSDRPAVLSNGATFSRQSLPVRQVRGSRLSLCRILDRHRKATTSKQPAPRLSPCIMSSVAYAQSLHVSIVRI